MDWSLFFLLWRVVIGRLLTELGRPRPRERLPKERSSGGWIERSETLLEAFRELIIWGAVRYFFTRKLSLFELLP